MGTGTSGTYKLGVRELGPDRDNYILIKDRMAIPFNAWIDMNDEAMGVIKGITEPYFKD